MNENIELPDIEQAAKEHFLLHFTKGIQTPCDIDISTIEAKLPEWYNEEKYKRGQKYFWDNRLAMLQSTLVGVIALLSEPKALRILASTGRSSTVKTARKRYVVNVIYLLYWCKFDLSPGSKSWETLNKVRKTHYLQTKSAEKKKIGIISQTDIVLTAFGFIGFSIIRPHLFGIRHGNRKDQEAFVHLWAVLLHMLGVQDKYNIFLLPFDIMEIVCRMICRYVLFSLIQIETAGFKHMIGAMVEGLSSYIPFFTYEYQMFQIRRVIGVPGYQYHVDKEKEILSKSLLTQTEIDKCNKIIFNITNSKYLQLPFNVPIIKIGNTTVSNGTPVSDFIGTPEAFDYKNFIPIDLEIPDNTNFRFIEYNNDFEWQKHLNDSKFYQMSLSSRIYTRIWIILKWFYEYPIGRYIIESLFNISLFRMENDYKNSKS